MVIENLYSFVIDSHADNQVKASVRFNGENPIYKGHFPQFAVTPGVCQLLLVKEILSHALGLELIMVKSREIKFLSMHDPSGAGSLDLTIKYDATNASGIVVNALVADGERKILKFNGEFRPCNV